MKASTWERLNASAAGCGTLNLVNKKSVLERRSFRALIFYFAIFALTGLIIRNYWRPLPPGFLVADCIKVRVGTGTQFLELLLILE